jgi:hypothetical protein
VRGERATGVRGELPEERAALEEGMRAVGVARGRDPEIWRPFPLVATRSASVQTRTHVAVDLRAGRNLIDRV